MRRLARSSSGSPNRPYALPERIHGNFLSRRIRFADSGWFRAHLRTMTATSGSNELMTIPPQRNLVQLSEDGYRLLKIYCPFCGSLSSISCEHAVARTSEGEFTGLKPIFAKWLAEAFGATPSAFTIGGVVPPTLAKRFLKVERLLEEAVDRWNKDALCGSSMLILHIDNTRRRESRQYVFASPLALEELGRRFSTSETS